MGVEVRLFASFGIMVWLLSGCVHYTVSMESFTEQLKRAAQGRDLNEGTVLVPQALSYKTIWMPYVYAKPKNGEVRRIVNSRSIEIRITRLDGKRTSFYFDTVQLKGEFLIGGRSRFIPELTKAIPIDSIAKIEIYNGHKRT